MGGDFLKGKYIHVGILFLLFPLSILCPVVFAISLKKIQAKMHLKPGDEVDVE